MRASLTLPAWQKADWQSVGAPDPPGKTEWCGKVTVPWLVTTWPRGDGALWQLRHRAIIGVVWHLSQAVVAACAV